MVLKVLAFVVLATHLVLSLPLDQFYPFGPDAGDTEMFKNDDEVATLDLNRVFPYFDSIYDTVYISNNGLISFEQPISDYTGEPFPLSNGIRMIAGYWGDVDTRSDPALMAAVFYRETTNTTILARASEEINAKFPIRPTFDATQVVVVTYYRVGRFNVNYAGRATFQIVLASDGVRSFTQLLYHELGWSGAQAGFNSGDSFNYFNLPGALTPEVTNLTFLSNIDIPGKFAFRIDSRSVQQGGCGSNFSLAFTPTSGNEMGGIPISFFGPCFANQSLYRARFGTEETACVVVNQIEVRCPLPFFIGEGFLPVNVWLSSNNGSTWQLAQGRFTYTRFENSLPLAALRTNATGYLYDSEFIEFTWDPMDGDSEDVQFEAWQINMSPTAGKKRLFWFALAARIALPVVRSGPFKWALRLNTLRDILTDDGVIFVARVGHRYVTSALHRRGPLDNAPSICDAFVQVDQEAGDDWTRDLPQCPLNLAPRPPAGWRVDRACSRSGNWLLSPIFSLFEKLFDVNMNCAWSPGAVECWKTRIATRNGGHQQCCYNENGNLITSGMGAGSPDRGGPLVTHLGYDLLPAYVCGCHRGGNEETCQKYKNRRPPSIGSPDPSRWRPTTTFGDPHFVTLDGAPFSFNGVGEFVLLQSVASIPAENQFSIQIRTREASFRSYRASVIEAVAVSAANGAKIGIYLTARGTINIMVDDVQIEYQRNDYIAVGEDAIEISTGSSTNIRVDLSNAVAIDITSFGTSLGVVASLPLTYQGQTEGLLGNWNGNPADDFKTKEGELVDINASLEEIHYNFGWTWSVTESTTLFFYPLGTDTSTFSNYFYTPTFNTPSFANATFEAQARQICAGSPIEDQCLFDAAVTNNLGVARESVLSFNGFSESLTQSNLGPQFRSPVNTLRANQGATVQHNFDVVDFEGDSYSLEVLHAPSGSSISLQGTFSWTVPYDWPTGVTTIDVVGRDSNGGTGGVSFNVQVDSHTPTSSANVNMAMSVLALVVIFVMLPFK